MFETPKFPGGPKKPTFGRREKPLEDKPKPEEGPELMQLKKDRVALQGWMGQPGVATSDDRKKLEVLNSRIAALELEDLERQRDELVARGEGEVSIDILNRRIAELESQAASHESDEQEDTRGGTA